MNSLRIMVLMLVSGLIQMADAAEAIGGYGIPYTARLVFQKSDLNKNTFTDTHVFTLKTGDELSASQQGGSNLSPVMVPAIKSNGWCDLSANPTTDLAECYGLSLSSQWFLLDLSKLGKRKIWAEISVQNDEASTDDNLIPAVTVWRGQQTQGLFGDWYPSKFNGYDESGKPDGSVSKAFWAWSLTPLNNNPGKFSWATAAGTDNSSATVNQLISLKGGASNYLTVIVGSDNQATQNQNANFKLSVKLSGQEGKLDKYNCPIGVECYHPQMKHCMAIAVCNDPQYKGQCLCTK